MRLAQDNTGQAGRDLAEAERILAAAWTGRGFHIPHFFGLFGRGQLAIYSGDTAAALDLLARKLPEIRKSLLLRIETIAVLSMLLEGTLAIACAASESLQPKHSSAMLRRARQCAKGIRTKPAIWGSGLAMLIEAGVEAAAGKTDEAGARLSDAERELTRAGMLLYATAARYSRGRLLGDPELVTAAEEVFRDQGIVCIPRFATMLAPGVPF